MSGHCILILTPLQRTYLVIMIWLFNFAQPVSLPHPVGYRSSSHTSQHKHWHSHKDRHIECNQQSYSALRSSSMSVLLNNTHIHTCTRTNRQPGRGSWRQRGMWYRNVPVHWYLPLITMCEGHLSPALVRPHKSLWNWYDGYLWRQLLPPGLFAHPSPPCCL